MNIETDRRTQLIDLLRYPAIVASVPDRPALFIQRYFEQTFGRGVVRNPSLARTVEALMEGWGDGGMLFAEIDGFGGIGGTFDLLRDLRQTVPDVPVVILTQDVSGHDLTAERLPICDATLHQPFCEAALGDGIAAALRNNRLWRRRVTRRAFMDEIHWLAPSRQNPRLAAPEPCSGEAIYASSGWI